MLQAAAAVDNLSQYSRRNSDNVSETGGDQSFHSKSFNKKGKKNGGGNGAGGVDKKKVLPTKKFPELKLMISGEGRNSNNTFSSDEEAGIGNVSWSLEKSQLLSLYRCNSLRLRREEIQVGFRTKIQVEQVVTYKVWSLTTITM